VPPVLRDRGAPPVEPPDLELLTDQGPMRSELLRQIAQLDDELGQLTARMRPWARVRTTPRRGPRLLDTADLERIRDELITAVHEAAQPPTPLD
jgi:hypothetical protein